MSRGPLFQAEYRPSFSGHETFPLRYGWLKKAFDAVAKAASRTGVANRSVFIDDSAIARFGVGRNMVKSMRHWAVCAGVVAEGTDGEGLSPTPLGEFLFGETGIDPYLEDPASLWNLHWNLCSFSTERQNKTTWFWTFNHFNAANFRREDLVAGLMKLAEARNWQRVSKSTVQRDVECFVRTYESHPAGAAGSVEDNLESPLAELSLIRGHKGYFHLVRGPKPSLPYGLFAVALDSFWNKQGSTKTLSFEMIAHEQGSPGRVFLLDETDLAERLLALEEFTKGRIRWSETAGLKQVLRDDPLKGAEKKALLRRDYKRALHKEAA